LIEKTNLDPREVGDIVVGSVLAPGSQRASECRMAAFYAGFPGMFLKLHLSRAIGCITTLCLLEWILNLVQKLCR